MAPREQVDYRSGRPGFPPTPMSSSVAQIEHAEQTCHRGLRPDYAAPDNTAIQMGASYTPRRRVFYANRRACSIYFATGLEGPTDIDAELVKSTYTSPPR